MKNKILLLPGDGIGPEIVFEAAKVLDAMISKFSLDLRIQQALIGGAAFNQTGVPLPEETLELAKESDAILLGAVGGPEWDIVERHLRPERGLLQIRAGLGLYANLRPAIFYRELADASTLKPEVISDLDIMIVRELTGGIYFGEPRGFKENNGIRAAFNTLIYNETEIERISRIAFEIAEKRKGRLCSVDKANVLESTELWREVVTEVSANYPDVTLQHMYVDNAAMQLVREPKQFDVILTSNMFGDILSDLTSVLTGSIGMLASASLNDKRQGLYEPIHGSAPDIAGQNIANPLATILSLAMMMRYSFDDPQSADFIENAVASIISEGYRTIDIYTEGTRKVSTSEMGDLVVAAIQRN